MLNIKPISAKLDKTVSGKQKNTKDDSERVIEFKLTGIPLSLEQITALVACSKHERKFADVAFRARDAMSELRHFKPLPYSAEVHHAEVVLELSGAKNTNVTLSGCSVKTIKLDFDEAGKAEMSCKVWAPHEKKALYILSSWAPADVYVSIHAADHGEEDDEGQPGLNLVN